jgi:hypothetical protein
MSDTFKTLSLQFSFQCGKQRESEGAKLGESGAWATVTLLLLVTTLWFSGTGARVRCRDEGVNSNFQLRSSKLNSRPQWCMRAHGLFGDSPRGRVFAFFSAFSIILLVLGHHEHSSSSNDTRPALKCNCHSDTTVWLKGCSPKASRSISRVSVGDLPGLTQNLMQRSCLTLLSITNKTKQNKTQVKKALVFKQCMFTARYHVAD